jgi:outer membrane translocation and assembly module TamA
MKTVGFGVRWQTPVGFVKADLAWPIVPDNMTGPRLHLGVGMPL